METTQNNDARFKFINAGETNAYYIYSVGQEKYVNEVSDGTYVDTKDSAVKWYINHPSGQDTYFIANNAEGGNHAWNNQNGWNNHLDYWGAADGGSQFTFEVVPAFSLDDYNAEKAEFQAKVTEWTNNASDAALYPNAEKAAAMQAVLDGAAAPTNQEEADVNIALFTEQIAYEKVVNLPATGLYRIHSVAYEGYRISAAAGHTTIGLQNNDATRTIWYVVTNNENGTCTFQNYLTKEYMQTVSQSARVAMGGTPVDFIIYPGDNNSGFGKAAFGIGGQFQKLHVDGSKNIVGWETANASTFTMTAVEEDDLATANTAEKTLAESEASTALSTLIPIANILGVTAPDASSVNSLNDYQDVTAAIVYEKAKDNVYRIVSTGRGKALGIISKQDAARPAGVAYNDVDVVNISADAGTLWQLRSTGNGFKFVNLNAWNGDDSNLCAIGNMVQGDYVGAVMKSFADAATYSINVQDPSEGIVRFAGAGTINMEGESHNFILNSWAGDNSNFTIQKIEDIEVSLADVDGNAWASAYLPFGVKNEGEAEVLVGSQVNESTVTMAEATDVAAKNGFVVKAAAGTQKATLKIDNSAATTSVIGGSTVATTIDDSNRNSIYVLGKGKTNNKIGFYNLAANGTVAANKAYITAEAAVNGFVFDGEATAIESVESNTNSDASIYDLSGRRVSKATKGIFIINGKKVIR